MLPKQYSFQLRKQRSFFQKARRLFSPYFTLFSIPHSELKAVVVIPKKIVKLASGRNAAKRRVHKAFTEMIMESPSISSGFLLCFMAKSAAIAADHENLKAELKKMLRQLSE